MFAQERRYFDVLLLRRLSDWTAMGIKRSLRPFGWGRNVRNPWRACLYCASGCGVVGRTVGCFIPGVLIAGPQSVPDIGSQTLEQRARVSGLVFLLFLAAE